MTLLRILAIKYKLTLMNGTGTHQGHMPKQDIEQLWQFVQICLAKKATDSGDTRILLQLHVQLVFLHQFRMRFEIGICVRYHRAKLQHPERPTPLPNHFSAIQYITSIVELDANSDD